MKTKEEDFDKVEGLAEEEAEAHPLPCDICDDCGCNNCKES